MRLFWVRNGFGLPGFDENNGCDEDDENRDSEGDDDGKKRGIAGSFLWPWVVVGRCGSGHARLDAEPGD